VSLVRLEGASFTYAGARDPSLRDLTLDVRAGELVAVAGRAGSGTTTLLLVAGGYAPRVVAGTLTGERTLAARRTAIVFATPWTQLTGLCHTVRAEVAFGPASHGLPREAVLAAAERAMRQVRVVHLTDRDPASLSGGELQRVIVASALALEPDLLVLDDPAAELDPAAADALYRLLRELAEAGAAVLVATPDTERVAAVATRALLLERGRLLRDGTPAEVLA
jgi:energy-coupling factor transporter ATP-binding protein EcfA2